MANNLNSIIKKTKGSSTSRKELLHKSPIPWLVVLSIVLVIGAMVLWPKGSDWLSKREELKTMAVEIPKLEQRKAQMTEEKADIEAIFSEQSEAFVKIAEQRLPDELDVTKMAQIIEMYTVLMAINYRRNTLELDTIGFGVPQNVDGTNYAVISANLNLKIDREMLKEFIDFLRSSRITDDLRNKVIASGGSETASIEFLDLNRLPVSRINSLSMNEERGRDSETGRSGSRVYNAQMQVYFYSKPL